MSLFPEHTSDIKISHPELITVQFNALENAYFIKGEELELQFFPTFLSHKTSQELYLYLTEKNLANGWKNIKWEQHSLLMFGKEVLEPRLTYWMGDHTADYKYSGKKLSPAAWDIPLNALKKRLNNSFSLDFNSVLLNWYRDGNDSMGWHADDEKELGQNPIIASANLGTSRRFLLRKNNDPKVKIEFRLSHGALLIMQGSTQHFWKHSVPKEKKVNLDRINLTFREIKL